MPVSRRVANAIWGRSGGRCYLEPTEILHRTAERDLPIGQIAHIVAESVDGPRGSDPLVAEKRNDASNLILLCPNHHVEVDGLEDVWTVERLRSLKDRHEEWVRESLNKLIRFQHRWNRSGAALAIEFESSRRGARPQFTFALKNVGVSDIIVHSVEAELLSVEVLPSIREREAELAGWTVIARKQVTFDLESQPGEGTTEGAPAETFVTNQRWSLTPFEIAVALSPGEQELFVATVKTGDFEAGTFRLAARFWDDPTQQLEVKSASVGFFKVEDAYGDWSVDDPHGVLEAKVLSFAQLVITAESEKSTYDRSQENAGSPFSMKFDGTRGKELACRTIGALDTNDSRQTVENWLESDGMRPGLYAVTAIRSAPRTSWRSAMIERALSSADETVREAAVSLVEPNDPFDPELATALTRKVFRDKSTQVRLAGLRLNLATSDPVYCIVRELAISDPAAEIRKSAARLLAERERLWSADR